MGLAGREPILTTWRWEMVINHADNGAFRTGAPPKSGQHCARSHFPSLSRRVLC